MLSRNLLIRTSNPDGRDWGRDAFLKQGNDTDDIKFFGGVKAGGMAEVDPGYLEHLKNSVSDAKQFERFYLGDWESTLPENPTQRDFEKEQERLNKAHGEALEANDAL